MGSEGQASPSRRDVLKGVAAVAVGSFLPIEVLAQPVRGRRGVTVFRLSTRGTRSCNACKIHHRFKIFISYAHANFNRAHPGCNCPITKQKISQQAFKDLFLDTGAIRDGVVDLRFVEIE